MKIHVGVRKHVQPKNMFGVGKHVQIGNHKSQEWGREFTHESKVPKM